MARLLEMTRELVHNLDHDPVVPKGKFHPVLMMHIPSSYLLMGDNSQYGNWQDVKLFLEGKIEELKADKDGNADAIKLLRKLLKLVKAKMT